MTTDTNHGTVLAVDDEEAYLEAYDEWLGEEFDVRTAADGEAALARLDETVDVVLLDRRMPGISGATVLERIRDRGLNCRVAMATGVEPDLDVIDMAFDDYLLKPVTGDEVRRMVETLLERRTLDEHLRECYALVSKKTVLEGTMDEDQLESTSEYQELRERLASVTARANASIDDLIERNALVGAYDDVGTRS